MGSQCRCLSSSFLLCWVSPQPAHGKQLHTHYSGRKELPSEPVFSLVTTLWMQVQLLVLLLNILPTRYLTPAPGEVTGEAPGLAQREQTTEYSEDRLYRMELLALLLGLLELLWLMLLLETLVDDRYIQTHNKVSH